MPGDGGSDGAEEDPRIAELREINARLKTVLSHLKNKHTPRSVETSIRSAELFMHDHTPAFVYLDGASFEGTRHVGSLMKLCDALEVKIDMAGADSLAECTALLERKVALLRSVYGV
jgi:hypothetical protein